MSALYYSPVLTKRKGLKPMSKTAMAKNLRELRKCIKELEQFDTQLADAMRTVVNMLSQEK